VGKSLVAAGAEVNAKNESGETPLIVAAIQGRNDFSAMLIENGADVNAVDNSEHSATYYAAEGGFTGITEQLIMADVEN
jgi:ankyrin repeat protein